jgi:type I restriction enzyme, S subunit
LFQGLAINSKTSHLLVEKSDFPLLRIKDLRNNTEEQYVKLEGVPKNAFVMKMKLFILGQETAWD